MVVGVLIGNSSQVAWINRMIASLWPYYNKAIRTMVDESLTATFTEICEKVMYE